MFLSQGKFLCVAWWVFSSDLHLKLKPLYGTEENCKNQYYLCSVLSEADSFVCTELEGLFCENQTWKESKVMLLFLALVHSWTFSKRQVRRIWLHTPVREYSFLHLWGFPSSLSVICSGLYRFAYSSGFLLQSLMTEIQKNLLISCRQQRFLRKQYMFFLLFMLCHIPSDTSQTCLLLQTSLKFKSVLNYTPLDRCSHWDHLDNMKHLWIFAHKLCPQHLGHNSPVPLLQEKKSM